MQYGINLLLWTGEVTENHFPVIEDIKKWGFDGVEIPLFETTESTLTATRNLLNNIGLECTTATCCSADTNPISDDPKIRQAARDTLFKKIEWSHTLGSKLLMGPYHSALGQFVGRGRNQAEWNWCVEFLRDIGEFASKAGIELSVEPLNRFEVYFLNTMADSDRLVAEVGLDNVGYVYDTFHANIEERDIASSVLNNAKGINHFHVSENDRGIPGQGHVRWEETFTALKSTGYDGWLTIEAFGRALPELAAATCIWRDMFPSEEAVAVEGLAFVRQMWERD